MKANKIQLDRIRAKDLFKTPQNEFTVNFLIYPPIKFKPLTSGFINSKEIYSVQGRKARRAGNLTFKKSLFLPFT